MCHFVTINMGQGRWIKERDGHYKHYTEEEYKNSSHGIAEKWARNIEAIIIVVFVAIVIIGLVISLIANIWQWIIGFF